MRSGVSRACGALLNLLYFFTSLEHHTRTTGSRDIKTMSGKYDPSTQADSKSFLDDRGYSGHLIRGQAPHLLFEEAVRNRVVNSLYWQEQCFGLSAATLCDRAAELKCIGGTFKDGRSPTPFLCLAFKMLQLNIEDEIIDIYLNEGGEDFKYLRALAAFYIRLTSEKSEDVYVRLEPLLSDYRKLIRRNNNGDRLTTLDDFVDDLLTSERVCATSLWKLVPRQQLEDDDKLEERISPVAHMLEDDDETDDNGNGSNGLRSTNGDDQSRANSEKDYHGTNGD